MKKLKTEHLTYVKKTVLDAFTEYRLKFKRKGHPKAIRFSRKEGWFYLTIRDRKHWQQCTRIQLRTVDYITYYGVNPIDNSLLVFQIKPSDRILKATLTQGVGRDRALLNDAVSEVISES